MSETPTTAELVEETSTWLVGGGVITLALFPLALPIVALTAIALIPFLLPVVAVGVVVAVVAFPVLLVRRGLRVAGMRRRSSRAKLDPCHSVA